MLHNALAPDEFLTRVKPACEKFLHSANKENLNSLNNEIKNIGDSTLDRFQSYILIPLLMKMDNLEVRNTEIKIELVNALEQLIKRIKVKDKSAIKTILVVCLKQIYSFEGGQVNATIPEELKLAILQCISITFQKSTLDILESFYSRENAGLIGKIAVTCVDVINSEKYRKLRIAAIECLMSAFYIHDDADYSDIVIRNSVADIIFVFLPKTVQTLISVANGEEKQGHKIISTSIKCLGRLLCLVFEDYHKNSNNEDIATEDFAELVKSMTISHKTDDEILGMNLKSRPLEERFKTLQSLERNPEWFGASSRKLSPILNTMIKLRVNSSQQVRKEYATMCCTLIGKCHKNLSENLSIFIENLFALSQDEDEQIRIDCQEFLSKINDDRLLSSILAENVLNMFEVHLISLPRIINRWDDDEQMGEFLFLKGILENMGQESLSMLLSVPYYIEKLCNCLIVALELELNMDLLKEEYAIRDVSGEMCEVKPLCWRKFKNMHNQKIIALIQSICEILGRSNMFDAIFDHLMRMLEKDTLECNEVLLILIMMSLKGESKTNDNLKALLDEILHERRWNLELQPYQVDRPTDENNSRWYVDRTPGLYESAIEIRTYDVSLDEDDMDTNSTVNISDAQFNVMHTCLMLDAIGHFALVLEDKFDLFMYKALHRVLKCAGSTNYLIHEAGMFALNSIQKGFQLSSVADLIRIYSNYISYHVNINVKKPHEQHSAFDILSTILRYSSFESLPYLQNILATIFDEISKHEQSINIGSFLKVFHMILMGFKNWSAGPVEGENCDPPQPCQEYLICVYEKWETILNNERKVSDDPDVNDICTSNQIDDTEHLNENSDEIEPNEGETTNKKTMPHHIDLVIKILNASLKFLSSKNQMHKILSLECIITGLPLLHQHENELLPIVHLIWYPFAERFKEKDVIVLNRCFTLLEVLATHAKDFILQRTTKKIFPFLCKFLQESSKNSIGKTYLVQTQEFKLQLKLIKELPSLIVSMEVNERELDCISEAVLLYMNRRQPNLLQENAIEYFHQMCRYNCPAVYIKLSNNLTNDDMKDNVSRIIDLINGK